MPHDLRILCQPDALALVAEFKGHVFKFQVPGNPVNHTHLLDGAIRDDDHIRFMRHQPGAGIERCFTVAFIAQLINRFLFGDVFNLQGVLGIKKMLTSSTAVQVLRQLP
jgi:hypothetical protein